MALLENSKQPAERPWIDGNIFYKIDEVLGLSCKWPNYHVSKAKLFFLSLKTFLQIYIRIIMYNIIIDIIIK